MTSDVIDTAHRSAARCGPHPLDLRSRHDDHRTRRPHRPVAPAAARLRTVLRADAVVTGAVGAVTLLAAPSLSDLVGTSTVLRVLGAVLLVAAVDIALLARLSGRRLAVAGTVVGELALAWVAATAVVVALGLAEPAGVALLAAVALATAAFGVTELRLVRQLRADA